MLTTFLLLDLDENDADDKKSHDEYLRKLLARLRQVNLKLNGTKVHLRKKSVPYIGHLLTSQGECVDPKKVSAITQMEAPRDVTALKRAKFEGYYQLSRVTL